MAQPKILHLLDPVRSYDRHAVLGNLTSIADADLVIDAQGNVVKARYGGDGRAATRTELAAAIRVKLSTQVQS